MLAGDCQFLRGLAEMEPGDNILEKWLHLTKKRTESLLGEVSWGDAVCFPWSSRDGEGGRGHTFCPP